MKRFWKWLIPVLALCALLASGTAAASSPNEVDLYLPRDADVYCWEYTVEDEELIDVTWASYADIHELGLIGNDAADWFHVKGLRPGTTALRLLYINQYTLRADLTLVYRLTVDEGLSVQIWGFEMLEPETAPRGDIQSFLFTCGGYEAPRSYRMRRDEQGELLWEVDDDGEQPAPETLPTDLAALVEACDVVSWNGFSMSEDDVLDGEDFLLSIVWENGFGLSASGSNAFPEHYQAFRGGLRELFPSR